MAEEKSWCFTDTSGLDRSFSHVDHALAQASKFLQKQSSGQSGRATHSQSESRVPFTDRSLFRASTVLGMAPEVTVLSPEVSEGFSVPGTSLLSRFDDAASPSVEKSAPLHRENLPPLRQPGVVQLSVRSHRPTSSRTFSPSPTRASVPTRRHKAIEAGGGLDYSLSLDEFVHNVVDRAQNTTSRRLMSSRRNKVPESGMPGLPTLASVAGSVPTRSVAVQAAPAHHQRYYFPDEQALGETKSDRHFFKYFDVMLPNQEVIDTIPTSLKVDNMPEWMLKQSEQWLDQRLYFIDYPHEHKVKKEPVADKPWPDCAGLRSAPRKIMDPHVNLWLEETAAERQALVVFCQYVAKLKPRAYVDEQHISTLRAGLIMFLSSLIQEGAKDGIEQLKAKAAHQSQEMNATLKKELDKMTNLMVMKEKEGNVKKVAASMISAMVRQKNTRLQESSQKVKVKLEEQLQNEMDNSKVLEMKLMAAMHEVGTVKKELQRERTKGQAKTQKVACVLARSLEHINSLAPPADPTPFMSQLSEDELKEVMVHLDPAVAAEMMKRFNVAISTEIAAQNALELASTLNSMDATHAASLLMQMDPATRAAALASMDTEQVAKMLDQLSMEDMVAVLNELSLEETAELLQTMDPNRAAEALLAMGLTRASEALAGMDEQMAAQMVSLMDAKEVASLIANMDAKAARAILAGMDPAKAAEVVASMSAEQAAEYLAGMEASKAAAVLKELEPSEAVKMLALMNDAQAAAVLTSMGAEEGAKLLEKVHAPEAAAYLMAMSAEDASKMLAALGDPAKAMELLTFMDDQKTAELLAAMDAKQAAAIVNQMDVNQAASALTAMDKAAAVNVVSSMQAERAAEVLQQMSSAAAAEILTTMDVVAAASVLNAMEAGKAAEALSLMDPAAAAKLMAQMDPDLAKEALAKTGSANAASILAAMESKEAAGLLNIVTAEQAAGILSELDSSQAALLLAEMVPERAAKTMVCLPAEKAAAMMVYLDPKDAARIADAMDSLKVAEMLEHLSAEKAAAMMRHMDADHSAGVLAFMNATAGAAILDAMDALACAAVLEKLAPRDPEQAQQLLVNMADAAHRTQVLVFMSPDLAAIPLNLMDNAVCDAMLLSVGNLDMSKRHCIEQALERLRASKASFTFHRQKEMKSLMPDTMDEMWPVLKQCNEAEEIARLMSDVDNSTWLHQASINSAASVIEEMCTELLADSDAAAKEVYMSCMGKVEEIMQKQDEVLSQVSTFMVANVQNVYKIVADQGRHGGMSEAKGQPEFLRALFSPAILKLAQATAGYHHVAEEAMEWMLEKYGIHMMFTVVDFNPEWDDNGIDDPGYADNIFVVKVKSNSFPQRTLDSKQEIDQHLESREAAAHIAAADNNKMVEDVFANEQICHVYPIQLAPDTPLISNGVDIYGTLALAAQTHEVLQAAADDIQELHQGMRRLAAAHKHYLFDMLEKISKGLTDRQQQDIRTATSMKPDGEASNAALHELMRQKNKMEKMLKSKAMLMMMAELKRYKKAPLHVIAVIAVVVLKVDATRDDVMNIFRHGDEYLAIMPTNDHVRQTLWNIVRSTLGPSKQYPHGIVDLMCDYKRTAWRTQNASLNLRLAQDLVATVNRADLERGSRIAVLVLEWVLLVHEIEKSMDPNSEEQ